MSLPAENGAVAGADLGRSAPLVAFMAKRAAAACLAALIV
jgi:hypothetical protein